MIWVKTPCQCEVVGQLLADHGGDDAVHDLGQPARHWKRAAAKGHAGSGRGTEANKPADEIAAVARERRAAVDAEHWEIGTDGGNGAVQQIGDR